MVNLPIKKLFTFPYNAHITDNEYETIYAPFIRKYKDWIYDIYFGYSMVPFTQDAMQQGYSHNQEKNFQRLLSLQEETGVKISATFNNIHVPSTEENLKLFINNLKPLYEMGLRSITQPSNHWMLIGTIKKTFPDMFIKNTVLKRVVTAQDFWNACELGYDYVNLDRILMRDEKELKHIKEAQLKYFENTGKYVYSSILFNEGCIGRCSAMDEHYTLHACTNINYFQSNLNLYTCSNWSQTPSYAFKTANIPPFKEDIEEIMKYIDIFKLHGRSSFGLLQSSSVVIASIADKNELKMNALIHHNPPLDKIQQWRQKIKNCRFQCWNCKVCDELVSSSEQQSLSFLNAENMSEQLIGNN